MIRLMLVIFFAYACFQVLGIVQKKYISEELLTNTIDKVVEIGGDTADALSLVYEIHKPVEED